MRVPDTVTRFNYKIIVVSYICRESILVRYVNVHIYVNSYDNMDVCIPTDFNEFCVYTSTYNGVVPPVKGIAKKNC